MTAQRDERSDPEDNAHTLASLWSLRMCELLCAVMFSTFMPWQRAFGWFGVISLLGITRWWHVTRPWFRAQPRSYRQRAYRLHMWGAMAFVGSSCFFLYVPGNVPVQALLMSYLLGNGTLIAVRLTGDALRTTIALCLCVVPTALRLIAEGIQIGTAFVVLMGVGGLLMVMTMVFLSRAQESSVRHQYELRRRAEAAANAVAAMGLTKSRFFAAVSHDLRQPVHAIGLYLVPLSILSQKMQDRAAIRAVEGINQSWRALDDLLSQVLDLTRMDSGVVEADLQPTEIQPLVGSLVTQHSAVAEAAGVRIVVQVRRGAFALADGLMLMRVLSNLLDNAVKFSPQGGTVLVALRSRGDAWLVQVRDCGVGIAHSAQQRIFEEFVQVDNEGRDRRRGLGLGLAIARRFAQLMNGNIEVRSALGKGCCMTVVLPKAQEPANTPHPAEGSDFAALGPAELVSYRAENPAPMPAIPVSQVLLVEDDSLVASATRQLLSSWGLKVRHVETAEEAMEEADYGQVAICDARLPGGASGLDVALALRNSGKKVLLISGETNADLRESAQRHDLKLLTKPVSSAQLLGALQDL